MGEEHAAEAGDGLIGRSIGGHEVVSQLGSGGMGAVYLARQESIGMLRAIKVIHDDHRADHDAFVRFGREAAALSRLQHHNVIQIIDFGTLENGWPYLAMEYVEGYSLHTWIARGGPMPLGDATVVLSQVAHALAYAHGTGVVHRDLKPGNLLLRHGDPRQVKVIDFGLARLISDDLATRLTAENQVLGSPLYMSPEQAVGSLAITGAADVYALAGIGYEMLSGAPVFPDKSTLEMIAAHSEEPAARLSSRCPQLPDELDELLYACLAKDPAARPTAGELDARLAALLKKLDRDPALAATLAPSIGPRPQRSSAVDLLQSLAGDPGSSMRDALVNQALAVVDEIAESLALADGHVARLHRRVRQLDERVTDLEMELAVLEAEGGDAGRRDQLRDQHRVLAAELADARGALIATAEGCSDSASGETRALHRELVELLDRLRAEVSR